uniref:Uncharacterized protein n=1 Tax=Magallana gigas TaxID=29159 RepID=K1R7R9_MAGGI
MKRECCPGYKGTDCATLTSVTRESLNTQRSGTVRVILGGTGGGKWFRVTGCIPN